MEENVIRYFESDQWEKGEEFVSDQWEKEGEGEEFENDQWEKVKEGGRV